MIYHEHPLRILKYSLKNIWLLIFPLLRGVSVLSFNPKGIYAWIKGAWLDIAVIGIILVYGFIRWYFSQITSACVPFPAPGAPKRISFIFFTPQLVQEALVVTHHHLRLKVLNCI